MDKRKFNKGTKGNKGGRPSKNSEVAMESILCYIFHNRYRFGQTKVSRMFGWETHRGPYDKLVSSTFKKRLAQGNKLMNE